MLAPGSYVGRGRTPCSMLPTQLRVCRRGKPTTVGATNRVLSNAGDTTGRVFAMLLAVLFATCVLLSQPAQAAKWYEHLGSQEALDPDARAEVARGLLEVVVPIRDAVPTLSPSQRQWLEEEREKVTTDNPGRLRNFVDSDEFAISKAKHHSEQLWNALYALVHGKINIKQQMLMWTLVSYHMSTPMLWDHLKVLAQRDLVDTKIWGGYRHPEALYGGYARDLLMQIVVPYLAGSLPE